MKSRRESEEKGDASRETCLIIQGVRSLKEKESYYNLTFRGIQKFGQRYSKRERSKNKKKQYWRPKSNKGVIT